MPLRSQSCAYTRRRIGGWEGGGTIWPCADRGPGLTAWSGTAIISGIPAAGLRNATMPQAVRVMAQGPPQAPALSHIP